VVQKEGTLYLKERNGCPKIQYPLNHPRKEVVYEMRVQQNRGSIETKQGGYKNGICKA